VRERARVDSSARLGVEQKIEGVQVIAKKDNKIAAQEARSKREYSRSYSEVRRPLNRGEGKNGPKPGMKEHEWALVWGNSVCTLTGPEFGQHISVLNTLRRQEGGVFRRGGVKKFSAGRRGVDNKRKLCKSGVLSSRQQEKA